MSLLDICRDLFADHCKVVTTKKNPMKHFTNSFRPMLPSMLSGALVLFGSATLAQNVGVDVSSPLQKLDVAGGLRIGNTTNGLAGSVRWTGTQFEGHNGTVWLPFLMGGASGFWSTTGNGSTVPANNFLGTTDNIDLRIRTNNIERAVFNANGNLGIGTISPNTPLHVLSANGFVQRLESPSTTGTRLVFQNTSAGGLPWQLISTGSGNAEGAGNLLFLDGTTLRMILQSSDGRVGMGTDTPTAFLDVAGVSGSGSSLTLRGGNAGNSSSSNQIVFGYAGTTNYRNAIKTRHEGGADPNNAIDFYMWDFGTDAAATVGTKHVMSITGNGASGSVGIGTNAPTEELHVAGSIRMVDGNQAAGRVLISDANGTGSWAATSALALSETDPQVNSATTNIIPKWNGTTLVDGIVFDNGTNIGIGTTTPIAKLDIVGTLNGSGGATFGNNVVTTGDYYIANTNGTGTSNPNFRIDGFADKLYVVAESNGTGPTTGTEIRLRTASGNASASDRVTINNTGNVGIGTVSPGQRLDVNGDARIQNGTVNVWALNATEGGQINLADGNSDADGQTNAWSLDVSNNDFRIMDDGLVRAFFQDNGNLGIGTTTPAQLLDVNGKIQMRTGATTGYIPVSDANGTMTWSNPLTITTAYVDEIRDADNDTKIQVEETADEDRIRFDLAGSEKFVMNGPRLYVKNSGASVFVGDEAGQNDDLSNNNNVFVGYQAGKANTTGADNTALGMGALKANTTASFNTAVGWDAMAAGITANNSTAVGHWSLHSNVDGNSNVAIGSNAFRDNVNGSNNTALGLSAGQGNLGSGNIFIGRSSGQTETGDNKLYIDNSGTTTPLIYGDLAANIINVNGNLGINTATPGQRLDVNGDARIQNGTVNVWSATATEGGQINLADGNIDADGQTNAWSLDVSINDFRIMDDGLVRAFFQDNGNLGIGTTAPAQLLDVNGKIQMRTGATSGYIPVSDANGTMTWTNPTSLTVTETDPQVSSITTNKIPKWNGTTLVDGAAFDNGANVGIGTTAPEQVLDVNGKIQMRTGASTGYVPISDANGTMTWTNPTTVVGAQAWKLTGNSGTVSGTNFIGTTDNVPVDIKANNPISSSYVRITSKGQIYEMGTGRSVFLGENAGAVDDLSNNDNVFVGYQSGQVNTTGQANTAVGYRALLANTTGLNNTAMGYDAVASNTTGSGNTGLGFWALTGTTGSNNAAVGLNALRANTTGSNNTALGNLAGFDNGTPANSNTTGSNNTFIGASSGILNSTQRSNATAIGYNAKVDASSAMVLGGTGADAVNVGIGVTAPAQTLDVNGKIQMRTGATTGYVPVSDANGTMTWTNPTSLTITETDPQVSSATTNFVPKWNGTTLVDGLVFDNGTNIGIGTTTPVAKLDIVGTLNGSGGATFGNNVVTTGDYYFANTNGTGANNPNFRVDGFADKLYLVAESSGTGPATGTEIRFRTASTTAAATDRMTINNNGNVGIGTTSPTSPLHVAATTAAGPTLTVATGSNQYPSSISILPSSHASSRRATIELDNWGFLQDINGSGVKDFAIFNNSTSSHAISIRTNGNVGIGTTSATEVLDVNGKIRMRTGATAGYVPVSDVNGAMTWTDPTTVVGAQAWKLTGNSGTVSGTNFLGTTDNVDLRVRTNNTDRLTVTASGSIGIGTTTVSTLFGGNIGVEIKGDVPQILFNDNTGGTTDDFRIYNGGAFAAIQNATAGIDIMSFGLAANTNNVGIGTTAPASKLHVVGSIRMVDGNQAANRVMVSDANGTASWAAASTLSPNKIIDADADTKIQVEESADEDIIRFDMGGTEYFTMVNGRINVLNTGNSVYLGSGAGAVDDFTSNNNVGIGTGALNDATTGNWNTAVGHGALPMVTTGLNNVGIGPFAMGNNTTGSHNTAIGAGAGDNRASCDNNVLIGRSSGATGSGSGNVLIGANSGQGQTLNNRLFIENSNSSSPLIYGEFDNDIIGINGSLGVGTTSPAEELHVVGNIRMVDGNQSAGRVLMSDANGTGNWTDATSLTITETDPQVSSTTTNYLPKWNGTTLVDGTIFDNGSVGIGTTSPSAPLHVAYASGAGPAAIVESGSNQFPIALSILPSTHAISRRATLKLDDWHVLQDHAGAGTKDFSIYQPSTASHRFFIKTDGNVGIGITSPGAKLDVAGTVRGTDVTAIGTNGNIMMANSNTSGTTAFRIDGNADKMYMIAENGSDGSATGTEIRFRTATTNAAAGDRMTINNQGNVGIGTAAPSEIVHVQRSTSDAIVKIESPGGLYDARLVFQKNGANTATVGFFPGTAELRLRTGQADGILFEPNGVERMRVNFDGNVGIATILPQEKLHVVGKIRMIDGNQAAGRVLVSDANGSATWTAATALTVTETDPQVSSTTTNYVPKWNGTTLTDGSIFDNGSVGIGTNTFQTGEKLAVSNGTLQFGILPGYLDNVINNNWTTLDMPGTRGLRVWDNFSVSGTVGIGTSTPAEELHVVGNIRMVDGNQAAGRVLVSDVNGTGTWTAATSLSITETDPQVSSATTNYVPKWNGTTLTDGAIFDNGSVGIGTNAPSSTLEVQGASGGNAVVTIDQQGTDQYTGVNIQRDAIEQWFVGMNNADDDFIIRGDGATDFVTIRNSDGNVGLGIAVPVYDLDIHKTEVAVNQRIYSNDAAGIGQMLVGANGGGHVNLVSNSSAAAYLGIPVGVSGVVTDHSDMVLSTGTGGTGTEKVRITTGGDVGVGTSAFGTGEKFAVSNGTLQFGVYPGYLDNAVNNSWTTLDMSGTRGLRIWDDFSVSGNVGIGATAPGAKLEVNSGGGTTTSLKLEHTGSNFIVRPVSSGGTSTIIENTGGGSLSINPGSGNVGIGSTAAGAKLEVVTNIAAGTGALISQFGSSALAGRIRFYDETATLGPIINFNAGNVGQITGAGNLALTPTGNVGIGTTTPTQAKFVVNGSATFTNLNARFYNSAGNNGSTTTNRNLSAYFSDHIACGELQVFSDQRIKNVVGVSDGKEDLATLMNIRVTDYTFKDTVAKGTNVIKKVIAQQVEQVYPQAVGTITDVVPDIYKLAEITDGRIAIANTLKAGEKVRLVLADRTELVEVMAADAEGFSVDLKDNGQVFVFGREVSDFRTVDYEALSMLNISATQELVRMINGLKSENEAMKANFSSLSSDVEMLKAMLNAGSTAGKKSMSTRY
jgi:hypothetical protein